MYEGERALCRLKGDISFASSLASLWWSGKSRRRKRHHEAAEHGHLYRGITGRIETFRLEGSQGALDTGQRFETGRNGEDPVFTMRKTKYKMGLKGNCNFCLDNSERMQEEALR